MINTEKLRLVVQSRIAIRNLDTAMNLLDSIPFELADLAECEKDATSAYEVMKRVHRKLNQYHIRLTKVSVEQ
jgi:hypothetical protein